MNTVGSSSGSYRSPRPSPFTSATMVAMAAQATRESRQPHVDRFSRSAIERTNSVALQLLRFQPSIQFLEHGSSTWPVCGSTFHLAAVLVCLVWTAPCRPPSRPDRPLRYGRSGLASINCGARDWVRESDDCADSV